MVIAKSGCKKGRVEDNNVGSSSANSSKDDKIEDKKSKGLAAGIVESTSVVNIRKNQQRSSLTIDTHSKRKSAMSR